MNEHVHRAATALLMVAGIINCQGCAKQEKGQSKPQQAEHRSESTGQEGTADQASSGLSEAVTPTAKSPDDLSEKKPLFDTDVPDPERWLYVEQVSADSKGGWATGSFDETRNKLTIEARDVSRFTIDTERVPINWNRNVVLSINGDVSELRRREARFIRFDRTEQGQWIVVEEKK